MGLKFRHYSEENIFFKGYYSYPPTITVPNGTDYASRNWPPARPQTWFAQVREHRSVLQNTLEESQAVIGISDEKALLSKLALWATAWGKPMSSNMYLEARVRLHRTHWSSPNKTGASWIWILFLLNCWNSPINLLLSNSPFFVGY